MNSKEVLQRFVDELHSDYELWYEKSRRRVMVSYAILQLISLLSGFGSAIVAAVIDTKDFRGWAKVLLIVLPALGSLAAGLLVQFRVYDLLRIREEGRLDFQELVTRGRIMLAKARSDEECADIHEQLLARASEIERSQSQRFFALNRSDFIAAFRAPRDLQSSDRETSSPQ
jgi:hypothetical protein